MKKFLLSSLVAVVAFVATHAGAQTFYGPITLNLKYSQEGTYSQKGRTNVTHTSTNITLQAVETAKTGTLTTASILSLLQSSFSMTFDKTDSLAISDQRKFYVVDKTKTNVVLDVSSVLYIDLTNEVEKGTESGAELTKETGTNVTETTTGSESLTDFGYATLIYDDSTVTTNPITIFHVSGIGTEVEQYNLGTGVFSSTYSIPSAMGYGKIQGTNVVVITSGSATGSVRGKYTGL